MTSTATVPADQTAVGDLVARADGVVAGLPVAAAVFAAVDPRVVVEPAVRDGDRVRRGAVLATVTGPTRSLLTAERTALNLLCHLSGVATATARWVDAVSGSGAAIRDTRKTTPGLRALEKYAVRRGGGRNHRMSLSDAALVKDNHVIAAGGVGTAFALVRAAYPALPVEVECDSVDDVREAVAAGADLVLLDNMTPAADDRGGRRDPAGGGTHRGLRRAHPGHGRRRRRDRRRLHLGRRAHPLGDDPRHRPRSPGRLMPDLGRRCLESWNRAARGRHR